MLNPDFALDARTETKKAEAVSTQKVKAMLVAWTNFLRKKMSGILRRIPRSNAKFGFNPPFFEFGASPSGKATAFGAVIPWFESMRPSVFTVRPKLWTGL